MNSYELIMFYYDKAEHYPISDRFIEKYQQRKNGYLDFAKKTGHLISANCHEPNQKWHLFESWFLQTVEEKKTDSDFDGLVILSKEDYKNHKEGAPLPGVPDHYDGTVIVLPDDGRNPGLYQ